MKDRSGVFNREREVARDTILQGLGTPASEVRDRVRDWAVLGIKLRVVRQIWEEDDTSTWS